MLLLLQASANLNRSQSMRTPTYLILASMLLGGGTLLAADQTKTIKGPEGRTTILTWGPAHPLPDQGEPVLAQLDRDGDGQISLVEAEAHRLLHSDFDYADLNDDGQISAAELARWVD